MTHLPAHHELSASTQLGETPGTARTIFRSGLSAPKFGTPNAPYLISDMGLFGSEALSRAEAIVTSNRPDKSTRLIHR